MFKKMVLTVVLGCGFAGSVFAEGAYWGVNFASIDHSEIDADLSYTAFFGRLGTSFNENFSGEVRIGMGMGDDSVEFEGVDINMELDNIYGGYIRGGFNATDSFFPYVVLGYSKVEISGSVSGVGSASASENDVSFGLGADFNFGEKSAVNVEYMNYLDKNGAEIMGISLGYARRF